VTSFATTEELRIELGLTDIDEQRAQQRLDWATAAIRRWTGQWITLVTDDEVTFQGAWPSRFTLPQVPVVEVTAIEIDGEPVTDFELFGQALIRGTATADRLDYERTGSNWGGDGSVMVVTYTHGYDLIPDDIKGVCISAAARGWGNPQGAQSETIGSYSIAYGTTGTSGSVRLTKDEKNLLRPLKNRWVALLNA
jgi:hypothetical protein